MKQWLIWGIYPRGAPDVFRDNLSEIRAKDLPITPMSAADVKRAVDAQYRQNFGPIYYNTRRGVRQLLVEDDDYARLPDLPGRKAIQIIRDLPVGSGLLDVGCGSGTFIRGVLEKVNPGLEAHGFDSREWEDEERLQHLKLGNIDDLPRTDLGRDKFEVVTCASVLYHLPDYWGAILRMSDRLKPDGVLLTSTVPRVVETYTSDGDVVYDRPADDLRGRLIEQDDGWLSYYRNRNIFDVEGNIVPMADVIRELNRSNPGFNLRYSVARSENLGTGHHGGQISVVRKGVQPLDLSRLHYCNFPFDKHFGPVSYILAKDEEEQGMLKKEGLSLFRKGLFERLLAKVG